MFHKDEWLPYVHNMVSYTIESYFKTGKKLRWDCA